jgi:uncharacterized repeat protein (TIGR04076 family)
MNADVKITVVRRQQHQDLLEELADWVWDPCERLSEGQEFVSTGANMPEGFCSWAWADMLKYVVTLARGGNFLGVRPGCFVTCCTDGFRPVLFKLERLED